mmetsp:Transcript_68653/g.147069  ORF Transcript_68653/g.147069 Transcript_68653/m.147069 type:complete len:210 (-) Transcript_68653:962-1591(-)
MDVEGDGYALYFLGKLDTALRMALEVCELDLRPRGNSYSSLPSLHNQHRSADGGRLVLEGASAARTLPAPLYLVDGHLLPVPHHHEGAPDAQSLDAEGDVDCGAPTSLDVGQEHLRGGRLHREVRWRHRGVQLRLAQDHVGALCLDVHHTLARPPRQPIDHALAGIDHRQHLPTVLAFGCARQRRASPLHNSTHLRASCENTLARIEVD